MQTHPIAKDLVLLGGGHSHVVLLRKFAMRPMPGLQITLISPDVRTPYSGMLPGVVAGHYTEDDIHIELMPLCQFAGARFIKATGSGIDEENQLVKCPGRPDIPYDILSIDIGITPELTSTPGATELVIPVKPISNFLRRLDDFQMRVSAGQVSRIGFVGAGAGSIELSLAIQHRLGADFAGEFHLYMDSDKVLPGYPAGVRDHFEQILDQRGFIIHRGFRVSEVRQSDSGKQLVDQHGDCTDADEIFWVTHAASQAWLTETGLALDDSGFVAVQPTLQSLSHPNVFAVGDIAHVLKHPRPKAGVYAVRQGPILHDNIRRRLLDKRAIDFKPQDQFLSLISTGDKRAVASRNGRSLSGAAMWRLKDWIDRRFMAKFNQLPDMTQTGAKEGGLLAEFDEQMRCAGCGSKISGDLLRRVLDEIGMPPGQMDDAAILQVPAGQMLLHTVDNFRSFVDHPFLFARITVHHALRDIYAMGGTPLDALAIVTVPYAKPTKTQAILTQVLDGVVTQLRSEGVSLSGGHTNEGAELSLGFAVNGTVSPEKMLEKGGLREGDALILTKPLGTGALFAANMQGKARGTWIESALDHMLISNGPAVPVMQKYDVGGCTDVTGFGLAGHLSEMLAASHCSATLDLNAIPLLDGLMEVLALGVKSSLHDGNDRSVAGMAESGDERFAVLFDPQTAGGLLISADDDAAPALIEDLHAAGFPDAAVIGRVTSKGNFAITFS
jgi:selenide,water dikinase